MKWLADLSLGWKVPLRVMLAVVGTALAVTAALMAREYEEVRHNLEGHAVAMGRVLARTLVVPVLHDDIWRAYEILQSAQEPTAAVPELQAQVLVVLDADFRVIASTQPRKFPAGSEAAMLDGVFGRLRAELGSGDPASHRVLEPEGSPHYYVMSPLVADGVALGHVVLGYSKIAFVPHFLGWVGRAAAVTVMVLLVLLPVSWVWARRTARPLVQLAEAMRQVPNELEAARLADRPHGRDEIGQLTDAFARMVAQLRHQQALESQMVTSERLAAIGRLTAGIAHEINNPLGGMLTSIGTYRRHGSGDALAERTLSLLERGLTQIRNTVGALLVETRPRDRDFAPEDVADLLILVNPASQARCVRVVLDGSLREPVRLPATMLRQITLNLLLNAVAAAAEGGTVRVSVLANRGVLTVAVCNDGQHIPQEALPYLFEPFFGRSPQGHGLGLWIVYQITKQLGGDIAVESEPGLTTVTIDIPHGGHADPTAPVPA